MNTFYGKKRLSSSSSSSIYRYRYLSYSKIPRFQAFWRGAAFWRLCMDMARLNSNVVQHRTCWGAWTICVLQNHFVSFLPPKIPMEFWNFGILLCKSLISLKKVDSNFTLRIGPLYIKTLKFQFSVSFDPDSKIPISSFQFQTWLESWNNFTHPWNAKSSPCPRPHARGDI
jgi:hypothetical protein